MPAKKEAPTFEKSVERLEGLIQAMENGDTPLADLVAKFEEGSKLLNHCQAQLKEAELKIEQLNLKTGELENFDDSSED
ncbi:MAG: exodeoxyribonuclease VII small subunit [Puniceicoccaceae bacterium]|jgi:exodeoxyribonuclease VII small subunit|nr:exodeoxyribonuclease VII small subunit [Puniceicoccaceae bacterium]RCL36082.1 MAG: exodeoxyribonuclease VII small subunit [Puniceicoccaceae bacterium]|tara:strand:- start:5345 stop:5581 length:237 start_codon:yes stop_codon:yes gene_type:complete